MCRCLIAFSRDQNVLPYPFDDQIIFSNCLHCCLHIMYCSATNLAENETVRTCVFWEILEANSTHLPFTEEPLKYKRSLSSWILPKKNLRRIQEKHQAFLLEGAFSN